MVPVNPELLKVFGFWGSILGIKLFMMLPLTVRQRFSKQVFSNPEDVAMAGKGKVAYNDPDVERVRRAHLNDLENIPIWYISTFMWLTTGPSEWLAALLIRTFVISRIIHTLSYAVIPQQPTRFLSFTVGVAVTMFQLIGTLLYYL